MRNGFTTEKFKREAELVHGKKYDYSKVEYTKMKEGVCIICPKHGEFIQTPYRHLMGRGCPICGIESNALARTCTNDDFIKKANDVHCNKYDYSKVKYTGSHNKVCIICPEHGEFWQEPSAHLSGQGCPICGNESSRLSLKKSKDEFIRAAKEIHGDKYDYTKVDYVNSTTKVCIVCPKHGEFYIQPNHHLEGGGCQKCALESRCEERKSNTAEFIEKAIVAHGGKYDYSKVEYVDSRTKVCIICPEHGEFWQTPNDHLRGNGCRFCVNLQSHQENEISSFIRSLGVECIQGCRALLNGKEIDIYLPEYRIGFEFDGLYWHSDNFINDKWYHLKKTEECLDNEIILFHIFEDEWSCRKEIIKSKIRHILGFDADKKKVMGRKCLIKEIEKDECDKFLNENHIQGQTRSTVRLGAFYNDELVGAMTFIRNDDKKWELNRYASNSNYLCQGVSSKLLSFFERTYEWDEIKSFADRRWTPLKNKNLYVALNFEFDGVVKPDYKYVVKNKRIHKFNFRKSILNKRYGLSVDMTENEMTKELGIHKIYDCGLLRYKKTNKAEK